MRLLSKNRAAIYSNASTIIKLLSGPIALLVLTENITELQQGIFFTFLSIAALQIILEAGMTTSLVQFISSVKNTKEEVSTLVSYKKLSFYWSLISALMFTCLAYFSSNYIFSEINRDLWSHQATIYSISIGLNILFSFVYVINEGEGKVVYVYKLKFIGSILSLLLLIGALYSGAGLWSLSLSQFGLLLPLILNKKTWELVYKLAKIDEYDLVEAFKNMWEFQSKLMLVWITGYLYWNSPSLILFKFVDPVYAGKFGLSFSLFNAINAGAQAWVITKRAKLGEMISLNKYKSARKTFDDISNLSKYLYCIVATLVIIANVYFEQLNFLKRMLPFQELIIMSIYFLLLLRISNLATYSRCYKKEIFYVILVIQNITVPVIMILANYVGYVKEGLVFIGLGHVIVLILCEIKLNKHERPLLAPEV